MSLTHLEIYFSPPVSDSVSTFPANSSDNTRHSPLLRSSSHLSSAPPNLLRGPCLVSDPAVFLPLWPLMVYFVSNLFSVFPLDSWGSKIAIFFSRNEQFSHLSLSNSLSLYVPLVFVESVHRKLLVGDFSSFLQDNKPI